MKCRELHHGGYASFLTDRASDDAEATASDSEMAYQIIVSIRIRTFFRSLTSIQWI